jgi:hypothetical protein
MKFKAYIQQSYADAPKEHVGLEQERSNIGKKEPLELSKYAAALVRGAFEFALGCGMPFEEANRQLNDLKMYLVNVKIVPASPDLDKKHG